MAHPLPFAMNTRLSPDHRQLLEETAAALDLTLSGAIRWHLDQVLDRPVSDQPGAPTRRELLHEVRGEVSIPGVGVVTIESVTRAEAEHASS